MVLIISQHNEYTTQQVIDWLVYMRVAWFRINEDDRIEIEKIILRNDQEEPEVIIRVNGSSLDLAAIKSYWYRRGGLTIYPKFSGATGQHAIDYNIHKHITEEVDNLFSFLFEYLKTYKHSLGDFYEARNKKLHYLTLARQAGLQIPATLITSDLKEVKNIQGSESALITKNIHEILRFEHDRQLFYSYTNVVGKDDLTNLEHEHFFPSLFQKQVDKKAELRIFFLGEQLYPMAIFSQENEKTKVDFRHYDQQRPNRSVPFRLPDEVALKVRKFIALSGLDTGSLDMILTSDNRFVFLEVNAVGQFGMTSNPCNYHLEHKVAKYLADGSRQRTIQAKV